MKLNWYKLLLIIFILGNLVTCIDPFSPNLDKFESLLVVDALLTDEYGPNYVSLSRTIMTAEDEPDIVSGALVQIKDDAGNGTILSEISKGIYKTDSLEFKGEAGRSYTLYIKTDDGEEYESDKCFMWPVQDIDSIYITKGQEIVDTEPRDGIKINIDSKGESACKYYRWKIEEWWKFEVRYPKAYNYIDAYTITPYNPVKRTCWANNKSYDIIVKSSETGISDPIMFIASEESDRLLIQYFIEVKQLSISKSEYEFWESMQKINETGGDIFDKQPFQIYGNIHNINRSNEQVLGYFQVSGAKVARRYITQSQLATFKLPKYKYDCGKIELGPIDFLDPALGGPLPTLDQIYGWYTSEGLTFIWALFFPGPTARLVFVDPYCADCTLRGSLTKPDFWIDLN
ncbi:MAG TPA: DUF4249 domain-containing protein [Bacteroidales bacterium]|nr:DUF4249 domain-containing protein [Bacteroidales bacterium]